jgi:hypothetical protein
VKICNSPIEPTKIAVVPTHVREPVEEVDQTHSRSDDGEPLLGRGGREMRSRTPDSSVGLARPTTWVWWVLPNPVLRKGILVFLLWANLLFLSHFNFLQLMMC